MIDIKEVVHLIFLSLIPIYFISIFLS